MKRDGGALDGRRGRRRYAAPALVSLLLHAGTVLAFAALQRADSLPAPTLERGVEVMWQDNPEDFMPGEGASAPPASAEAEPRPQDEEEPPREETAQAPPPEPPPPDPPPPPPPPPLELETPPPPPVEAVPPPVAEAPPPPEPLPEPPPPEPVEAQVALPVEELRPADLPPPPPAPPEPPAPPPRPAPRQPPPQQARPQKAAPPQREAALAAAAAARPPPGPAAPQDAPNGASRAVGAVSPPGLLEGHRNPEPEYPFASRQRGDQGVVTVRLGVSAAGEVTEVEVVATSGYPALDEAARRAVQRWRFRPAIRDGAPVPGSIRTAIHFRLR